MGEKQINDLTKVEVVKTLMENSLSEDEWNANCDKVKKANNGYPAWWLREIVMSGLMGRVTSTF